MQNKNWRRIALLVSMALFALIFFGLGIAFGINYVLNKEINLIAQIFQIKDSELANIYQDMLRGFGQLLK